MGTAERRERERLKRMDEILSAAAELVFTTGVHETSMDQIADKAELSKGTLYLYFQNKSDLLAGLCNRGLNQLKSMFEAVMQEKKTGAEQLEAIGKEYLRFAEQERDYYELMLYCMADKHNSAAELDPQADACHQTGMSIHKITAKAIKNGIQDKTIHTLYDPMELAVLMWGQTTGVIQIVQQNKDELQNVFHVDTDRMIEIYFQLVRSSLRNIAIDNSE
ncbi:MAG: TetR/AcrR family transcriptional regulator [candidate division KSB1 bacterium]|nr:TetR/AcrR family transcriptional regulator [candidate division KSB1 bacterium]